jgi:hypothetical protein
MEGLLPLRRGCAKQRLLKNLKRCRDAKMRVRYLIVVNLMHGRSAVQTAAVTQVD